MSGREGRIQMPKHLTLCLCTLLLAFGSLAPGSTAAEPSAWGRDGQHHRVIQLTGRSVIAETIDLGEPGLSVGDSIVVSDDLFQDSEKVGVHGGTCTVVRVGVALLHCVVTFALPPGRAPPAGAKWLRSHRCRKSSFPIDAWTPRWWLVAFAIDWSAITAMIPFSWISTASHSGSTFVTRSRRRSTRPTLS